MQMGHPALPLTRRRKFVFALLAFLVLYIGGYLCVRSQHWLVHRSGSAYGNTDNHSVTVGDLGLGWNPAHRVAQVSYVLFAPLRWAETAYWYLRHPAGNVEGDL
jgi:hypothetical protein